MTDADDTRTGAVTTLLELRQTSTGKRLAYCLPSGEFLFAVGDDAAVTQCFCATAAPDARALYGRNLCQFLAPCDIERLEDFMRGAYVASASGAQWRPSQLQLMVHVVPTGAALWVRLQTIPLSLRLERCIDAAVQSAACHPAHVFADASSFVVSEADFPAVLAAAPPRCEPLTSCSGTTLNGYVADGDDADSDVHDEEEEIGSVGYSLSPSSDVGLQLFEDEEEEDEAPNDDAKWLISGGNSTSRTLKALETKVPARHRGRFGKRTSSTASTDIADDDEVFAADENDDEGESLAGYAFEADWAAEVVRESLQRKSADWALRAAPVI